MLSRSGASAPAQASAEAVPATLGPGMAARLVGLVQRPELNDAVVTLQSFDKSAGHWRVSLANGETLRVMPGALGSDVSSATF